MIELTGGDLLLIIVLASSLGGLLAALIVRD